MRRNRRISHVLLLILFGFLAMETSVPTPAASASSETGTLQTILDGWADALGGRERLTAVETIHSQSKLMAFGLEGTVEEWVSADGRHRVDLDLAGLFTTTLVRSADGCWLLDQNGKVSNQTGFDRQSEITAVYLATWSHLLPDRMAGQVKYLGSEPETNHAIVSCTPKDGIKITFYIDAEQFLPIRSRQLTAAGEIQTITYEDWREIDGVLLPGTIRQSTGVPENDMLFLQDQVSLNSAPDTDTFDRPSETVDDVRFSSGNSARDIPLDVNGVHPFLQVQVNDSEPLWFILDTGASVTVLDNQVAADLGFISAGTIMARGAGEGRAAASFIQDASFQIPGVEVTGQTVAVIALADILEGRAGRRVDGVLGYDFISRFVVEVDYWNDTLHLYDRKSYQYDGAGERIPIRLVGHHPHCDAVITVHGRGPIPCNFMIDTGSGMAISVNHGFSIDNDLVSTLPKKVLFSGGFGIGGESTSYLGRIEGLKLGELEFAEPPCSFDETGGVSRDQGAGTAATTAGDIGGLILEQCTVIFDYERHRMILEPNPGFASAINLDMSGVTFTTGGRGDWSTFTVLHIIPGSTADRADLREDDIIISVDGKPAQEFRAIDLRNLFREEGRQVTVGIKRAEETFEKTLRLEPII